MGFFLSRGAEAQYLDEAKESFIHCLDLLPIKVAKWVQYRGCITEGNRLVLKFGSSQHPIYFEVRYRGGYDKNYFDCYSNDIYEYFKNLKYLSLSKRVDLVNS